MLAARDLHRYTRGMRLGTIFALLCLMAGASFAQVPPGVKPIPDALVGQTIREKPLIDTTPTSRQFVAVTGAPYSGEEIQERIQILADGTRTTKRQTRKLFRDGQGRERIERGVTVLVIEIDDPVAGFRFMLDTARKVARRSKLVVAPPNTVRALTETPAPGPGAKVVTQSLGTRMIEGVSAVGTLDTTSTSGSNPIVSTVETWRSPELRMMLLVKSSNPRLGDEETRIVNISRSEPRPELFRPPADYGIVDETPPFTGSSALRPGGSVSMPAAISRTEPEYTPAARAAGIQGAVTLSITVGKDGLPRDIRVVKSLDPGLDQKAIEAVTKWRFRPGQKDGQALDVQATIEVNFRL